VRTDATLSRALRLRSWTGNLVEGDLETRVTGEIIGDTALRVTLASGGESESLYARLPRPVFPPVAMAMGFVARRDLRVGQSGSLAVLDPRDLSVRDQRASVAAESLFVVPDSAVFDSASDRWIVAHSDTVRAWRIDGLEWGLPVHRWVDAEGLVVRTTAPLGLTLERSAFEIVSDNYRKERHRLGADSTRSQATRRIARAAEFTPGPPEATRRVMLLAEGAHLARIALPGIDSAPGQRRTVDTVDLSVIRRGEARPDSMRSRNFLQPGPLIDSGDSAIRITAAGLVDPGGDPWRSAGRLTEWVSRSTTHSPEGLASASRTLARRGGSPADRAILLAALARAAGIPARTVGGLLRMSDGWHYHVWVEVYAGGWVPADPELGQFPADANHLRLTTGGLGRETDLLPRIGHLQVNDLAPNGPS
jgi:hypothetical protein